MIEATPSLPLPDTKAMIGALSTLFSPTDVVELRAIGKGRGKRVCSGYFDATHWKDLTSQADRLNRRGDAIYITLNPVNPQLLSRYHNRVEEHADKSTSDRDILRRRWLLVDLDPVRPAETSSSDAQLSAARAAAERVWAAMVDGRGWPIPLVAASGNGMHLLWRIDLTNDLETMTLVKDVLRKLAEMFDSCDVKVDQSVFNAARICKLWGTVATKGDHAPGTPHRLSELLAMPSSVAVSTEQLRELAAHPHALCERSTSTDPSKESPAQIGKFVLEEFLAKHGLSHSVDKHNSSDRFKLDHCPFNAEHVNGEAAIFRDIGGRLGFKCQHSSCSDKNWRSVRDLLDGTLTTDHSTDAISGIDLEACIESARRRRAGTGATPVGSEPPCGAATVAVADEPLSGMSHAPVFNYGICPGVLERFIRSETAHSEAPPIGVLANIVTRLSADMGRTCFMRVGRKKIHLRINWLCAGPTAMGRKGTAAGIADEVRRAAFQRQEATPIEPASMKPARVETSLATGEGLVAMLRTSSRKEDGAAFKPPGLVDNRLLVDAQEFSAVLKKASGKEATLSARLREGFDGETLSNTSASNAMQAEHPHVVVNASVPDGELVRLLV
jgi:hypothetical protein